MVAKRSFFRKRKVQILLGIIVLLVILRLLLPYIVLRYCNNTLANMNGYYGHIEDIDIALYRGAYKINDMYLDKKDSASGKQTPFFKVRNIDLSVEWKAIFKGGLVGELEFDSPDLIFTKDRVELGDVKKDTNDFRKVLKDFMPLKVNRFQISNGALRYTDNTSSPKVDIALKNIQLLALNLRNAYDSSKVLPSTVTATAGAYEGTMELNMKLNPLATAATFDMNASVKDVNLVLLNDFLKAYGKFDVHKGNFGLYSEMAAKNGQFKGYVKPLIKGLDVVGAEDRHDSFLQKIWETVVGGAGELFRNHKKDQVATKVQLEGNFKDPNVQTLDAIWQVLRNAFIQALLPSVDNQIDISSVGTDDDKKDKNFFQKLFGKKDKDKDEDKGKDKK